MAVTSRRTAVLFDHVDLSGGVQQWSVRQRVNNADTTVVPDTASSYLSTVSDGMMSVQGIFERGENVEEAFAARQSDRYHVTVAPDRQLGGNAYTGLGVVSGLGSSAPYRDAVQIDGDVQLSGPWQPAKVFVDEDLRDPWLSEWLDLGATFAGKVHWVMHLTAFSPAQHLRIQSSVDKTVVTTVQSWLSLSAGAKVVTHTNTVIALGRYIRLRATGNCSVTGVAIFES